MNQPTYYTPSIEEFHVGFEFEWQGFNTNKLGALSNPKEWNKVVLTSNYNHRLEYVAGGIENGYIRVKHLDHDDIVECGWITKTKDNEQRWHFRMSCYSEKHGCDIERTLMLTPAHWVMITEIGVPRFSGTLLNKSELKFIMKRLGIV